MCSFVLTRYKLVQNILLWKHINGSVFCRLASAGETKTLNPSQDSHRTGRHRPGANENSCEKPIFDTTLK